MKSTYTPALLSYIVAVGFLFVLWYIIDHPVPTENEKLAYLLTGILGAKFGDIVGYWIGSSIGSTNKDKTLHAIASQQTGEIKS